MMDTSGYEEKVIRLEGIGKSFYGVEVLRDINLEFRTGEVHIVCGENGAGKSTLIKIIAGLYKPTKGKIIINGVPTVFASTKESEKTGVAIVYQELSLCPTVSIAENIFLNREFGALFVNKRQMREEAKKYMDEVGLKAHPDTLVKNLSIAEMQMVQIVKALSQNARIIVLDEPCSSLTEEESDKLFRLLLGLKAKGVGIIYIDHRLENFQKIGDKVTVLRDGAMIGTLGIAEASRDTVIQMMVGRKVSQLYHKDHTVSDRVVLEVSQLKNNRVNGIDLTLKAGEVLGLGGMVGAGRSEIIRAIFGVDEIAPSSRITVDGKVIKRSNPIKSMRHGIGYIPEDRKLQSLLLLKNPDYNISLAFLDLINKGIMVKSKKLQQVSQKQIDSLKIKIINRNCEVNELSGGNQQKIVMGKWLINDHLKILLLDEPTRGVDIGVKVEIYKLIDELAKQGVGIILVTSELPELIGLSDKIAVIKNGSIAGILQQEEFSQEKIMQLCI
jgi:ABC-type sugar transport system ATPase subunit